MTLLTEQPEKTPGALDDVNRKTHEIDSHTRVYLTERSRMFDRDDKNHDILATNKLEENYECTTVSGIKSCYNVIAFKNDAENKDVPPKKSKFVQSETGDVNTDQTAYLPDGFCSCDSCRSALVPDDFLRCK
jgi:hypothetical protein